MGLPSPLRARVAVLAFAASAAFRPGAAGERPDEARAPAGEASIRVGDGILAVLASVEEGQEVLGQRDELALALGDLERRILVRSLEPVSEETYRKFAAEQVRAWEAPEQDRLRQAFERVAPRLESFARWLPPRILAIKTTGREEWGAAYTRGAAIILNPGVVAGPQLERLLAHELFHLLTRRHPRLKKPLYEIVGFENGLAIELPPDLAERRITNPDAPLQDCAIRLPVAGEEVTATPVLFSRRPRYDPEVPTTLNAYLDFKLLVISEAAGRWQPRLRDGKPWLLEPRVQPGLMEKIGRNTAYILHPEEILADNFVLLLNGAADVPTPGIIERLREVLSRPARRRARI